MKKRSSRIIKNIADVFMTLLLLLLMAYQVTGEGLHEWTGVALTAICGVSMSNHVLPFLYGILPISFVRRLHLAMSFWSFVLMGVHLGFHIPALTAGWKPGRKAKPAA